MEQNEQLAAILEQEATAQVAKIKDAVSKALMDIADKYEGLNTDGVSPAENLGRLLYTTDAQLRGRLEADLKKGIKGQMVRHMLELTTSPGPASKKKVTKKTAKKTGGK